MNQQSKINITPPIERACEDYFQYIDLILKPAKNELEARIRNDEVALHHAFGANLILAHSVDYLLAILSEAGINESRRKLVMNFDERFSVPGAYIRNRKMELADAINNALKHIRLDQRRYGHLEKRYGQITFQSLIEDTGSVICILEGYRFDYCRVVLLPALGTLSELEFSSPECLLRFLRGEDESEYFGSPEMYDPSDPSTAIDRMIDICSSPCMNCGEGAEGCLCSKYIFEGEEGRFEPLFAASANEFEELMMHISPSYGRE